MNKFLIAIFVGLFVFVVFACLPAGTASAATTGYAWSDNAGWINFGCTNCNVQVTDTAVTGYVWSANYGWIKLNPSTSGVRNTTLGVLSGYAWGENTGWINFSGATITCDKEFTGQATGDVVGTITFDCSNCNVATDWLRINCGSSGGTFYNLTITANHGLVSPGSGPYANGAFLTPTATPDPGYVFSSWSGDLTGAENPESITMDSNKNVAANFTFTACPSSLYYNSITGDCVACNSNSECGIDGYTSDPAFCQNGNVYQNYTSYTCSNPGAKNSVCSSSTNPTLKETCAGGKTCYNGSCQTVACSSNSDCGTGGYAGSLFCQNGNVYQNYTSYTCSNPGAGNSSCSSSTEARLKETCASDEVCKDGDCVLQQHAECSNQKCAQVPGAGADQCVTDNDCKQLKHNICSQQQCVSVGGAGPDECQVNSDCQQYYFECKNFRCVSSPGIGIDQCAADSDCAAPKHNECQNQQCVVVDGAGGNQCLTSNDCVAGGGFPGAVCGNGACESGEDCNSCSQDCGQCTIINIIADTIQEKVIEVAKPVVESVKIAAKEVKQIVNTPEGSITTKTISTVGAVTGAVAISSVAVFAPSSIFELFFILPVRILGLLMAGFGIKKKKRPWGVVYDSVTKQPIDPAYVVLKDENGNIVSTVITDIDGRYGFFVKPGIYYISARKTNYGFPSQKLLGKVKDEIYDNLYLGEKIEIFKEGDVIRKNIPMDPLKFDWNEFAKKDKSFMKFFSHGDVWSSRVTDFIFTAGFFVAAVALLAAPYPYNFIIFGLYIFLLTLRIFGLKLKPLGHITYATTGIPLSFAIIRIIMPETNLEISHQIADKYGRYYCLVPRGKYYVKIEKKNDDGSYSQVYTSGVVDASKKGIIKEGFKI